MAGAARQLSAAVINKYFFISCSPFKWNERTTVQADGCSKGTLCEREAI
jgi:hypothetical protein